MWAFHIAVLAFALLPAVFASVIPTEYELLPSLREQDAIQRKWVDLRQNQIIPQLLEEHGVELWLISQTEYNEDSVFWGLVPRTTTFSARRRTMQLFYKQKDGAFKKWLFVDNTDNIWANLTKVLYEVDPASIAVNIDSTGDKFADGIHAGEYEKVLKNLPLTYWWRVTRKPLLATQFIATRVAGMLDIYQPLMRTAHSIIREAFSARTITPGVTSTEDLQWFLRERIQSLNLTTWFHPSVDVQRFDQSTGLVSTYTGANAIIQKGDLIWTDFGVTFMGLNTDTQHNGYMLRDGETDAPLGLRQGLTRHSNVIQDILMREIKVNLTGNAILKSVRDAMDVQNISGSVYCHPIGDFGHAAGTLIGMTNLQDKVPVIGDVPVFPRMWFSIELQADVQVLEWNNQKVNFRQEEDMFLDSDGIPHWVVGRQSELHLIGDSVAEPAQSDARKSTVFSHLLTQQD
ncbi:putative lipoprotein [Chytriomyces sp. MP71]|nr:putative lipoprotein [Chytriomyces sp. MP71]